MSWDMSRGPLRPKYLEEEMATAGWYVFGEHLDGTVDVQCCQQDIFTRLPRTTAEALVRARGEFCARVAQLLK